MDTIFYNGVIHTMTGRTVSALAVQNGRIAMVGRDEDVLALRTGDTRMLDLEGRCVLPGFTDSHMHALHTGLGFRRMDLRGVKSPEELIARGRAFVAAHALEPDEWVVGYGYDHNLFDPPVLPGLEVADAISTDHPVVLDRICGHVGAGNTLALKLAGFDENTVIVGGELDKDENGKLNGVVREAALDRLKQASPRICGPRLEQLLEDAGRHFAAAGITGAHSDDIAAEGTQWPCLKEAFAAMAERGSCRFRVWEEWEIPRPDQMAPLLEEGLFTGWGSDWLRFGNVKLLGDGSLGARTASLREDYSDDPGNRGIAVYTQEEMDEMVALCHAHDLQVACHCIGDGSCERFVHAVEKAMAADPKPLRHRVVHCQIGDLALYRRMGALGMGADIQAMFVPSDASILEGRLGERAKECYAWKTLLDCGVLVCGGSDSPVEDYPPLWGIHCAVNRPDGMGGVWRPEECLTVEQAVALYTVHPARLMGAERDLGTLEAGKLADLVVLDKDIFAVSPETIKDLRVEHTMVGGKFTFGGIET